MSEPRIGAFICGCGGNISDYVDIEAVAETIREEDGVSVSRTAMFTCSEATQQEIIDVIKEHRLTGIVVASCSPKLHLQTFRAMAQRAGLNRYVYSQVNIREQCSWTHTHDRENATRKAISLVRAGVARTRLSAPLNSIRIDTVPTSLVVGAGVAGLRAAVALADLGVEVHLVERAAEVGGQIAKWGALFPNDRSGREIIETLSERVATHPRVHLHTASQVVEKSGCVGDFKVTIQKDDGLRTDLRVGAILVATGFSRYEPRPDEFGRGLPGVVTLDEFRKLLDDAPAGELAFGGKPVRTVAYVYCVGSRECEDEENGHGHTYCSRFCCTAAVHTALLTHGDQPSVRQFHLYRDMRTYGKQELLCDDALSQGSLFLMFPGEEPPVVTPENGRLRVRVKDQLTGDQEIVLDADLVVLVTGMEARANDELVDVLKLPIGLDGFFNEIHPKLRPVETVMDGLLIAGASQGPKNLPESVASAMSAVAKTGALLMKGYIDLEPFVAKVTADLCTWCGDCAEACPYGAIGEVQQTDKAVAVVNSAICKGCGVCVAACEPMALDVEGYTHEQIESMIDALAEEVVT